MTAKRTQPRLGVLALQGDFQAHARMLARLGRETREVRRASELEGLDGLVLPGGESTTMWHFLERDDLGAALQRFAGAGGAVFGTCAGAILMARGIQGPDRRGLGLLDIDVQRNGYGRQTDSRVARARGRGPHAADLEAILIRAPRIVRVGAEVDVRAWIGDDPAWVEAGTCMATTFHPELGEDTTVHRRFVELAAGDRSVAAR